MFYLLFRSIDYEHAEATPRIKFNRMNQSQCVFFVNLMLILSISFAEHLIYGHVTTST